MHKLTIVTFKMYNYLALQKIVYVHTCVRICLYRCTHKNILISKKWEVLRQVKVGHNDGMISYIGFGE